jgi:hypothetical protein
VILLCAIAIAVIPTAFHTIRQSMKARRLALEGRAEALTDDEIQLDKDVFRAGATKAERTDGR